MFHFIARRFVGPIVIFLSLVVCTTGCLSDSGHTHAAPDSTETDPSPIAVTVFTEEVELFMEYPRLLPGAEARFLAHVTVLADGAPVRSGELRLDLRAANGDAVVFTASAPERDGLFIPVGALSTVGQYSAQITVVSEQVHATITLPPITVYAGRADALAASMAEEEGELPNAVPFLLEQQWKVGLLMQQVKRQSLTERLLVPGEVKAAQGGMAMVSAPLAGRLLPVEGKRLPQIGDLVAKGQVLAYLEPPLTTGDLMQLSANEMSQSSLAMEVLARELDLQTKSVEVEQSLQQSFARLDFAQLAMDRMQELRESGLGTKAEVEAMSRDLELARQEKQGAERLQKSLELAQKSLLAMRKQLDASDAGDAGDAEPGSLRVALLAPMSGEVIAVNHVVGEQVESLGAIFEVLDSSQLWISAHISEFDLDGLGETPGALLEFASFPDRTFDVLGAMGGKVISVGRMIDPVSRTMALHYQVPNPEGLLRVGMFADVFLETQSAKQAIAIPQQAVVLENGRPVAFVLMDGETFQKRDLNLGIRDGDRVEVLSGVEEGERVVTQGAFLVRLAMASPASFGEGHAH
ncbi:MAG: efflux RND transporter periplasmic adaptor subunit [Planctomycetota bacterium]|nr:efflux RND transporter periplasmic adaptor subunit [Planctomycetota bacterium]MDA1114221.1 efflux RND transporter periplasmic adaptor subunit [Planctomycetota bacterium]